MGSVQCPYQVRFTDPDSVDVIDTIWILNCDSTLTSHRCCLPPTLMLLQGSLYPHPVTPDPLVDVTASPCDIATQGFNPENLSLYHADGATLFSFQDNAGFICNFDRQNPVVEIICDTLSVTSGRLTFTLLPQVGNE